MGTAFSHWKQTSWPVFAQMWPPASKFNVGQIPDLTGRIVIVTGGNSGSGYETVLLQRNAKVYLASRSRRNADAAIASLKDETGKQPIFLELDLASLSSVKKAADEVLSKEPELHILFCNAGVMWTPIDQLSEEGYDLQWGTNVVGHFYFTELLMPALFAGAKTSPDRHARVITTASSGAYLQTLEYDTLRDGSARRELGTTQLYYQSKHGNAIVARQIAKRYADRGIVSISVNPGNFKTNLTRHASTFVKMVLEVLLLYPAPFGALTQLFSGTMPEALNYNGEFMIPWARLGRCHPEVYNDEVGNKLWDWLEGEVKAFEASRGAE
ncbi:NAD(P)-binding protein [Ganoderma leucocontextum]|nr:NAD(P)-binding protein [Ganoderma leucocontextum]